MELVNITQHDVELRVDGGLPLILRGLGASAEYALAVEISRTLVSASGRLIPLSLTCPAGTMAPARQPGVLYVASQMTCLSLPDRDDLAFPYPVVKYPDGHPRQGQPAYAIGLGQSVLRIVKG